tara:strand:- start:88 stop:582 length:495 start_codon:yes stop_codon:yes gene_type:complete
MNKYKDKNGVLWMSTTAASKAFRVPSATLYGWKYTGDMKEGVHYTTNKYPPRKIYWNTNELVAFIDNKYPGRYAIPQNLPANKPKNARPSKSKKTSFSPVKFHASLTQEAVDAINLVKESLKIEVQHSLNGVVIARNYKEPSMQMVCNMLLVKGAETYLDEQAA